MPQPLTDREAVLFRCVINMKHELNHHSKSVPAAER